MILKNKTINAVLITLLAVCIPSCSSGRTHIKSIVNRDRYVFSKNKRYEKNSSTPDFTLEGENGQNYNLSAFHGKWVLLYFWTSKSEWSVSGLNTIAELQETFGDTLQTICMECYGEPLIHKPSVIVNKNEIQMIMCKCSVKSKIFRYFNVQSFPTRILISPQGKVVEIDEGAGYDGFPISNKKYLNRMRVRVR